MLLRITKLRGRKRRDGGGNGVEARGNANDKRQRLAHYVGTIPRDEDWTRTSIGSWAVSRTMNTG